MAGALVALAIGVTGAVLAYGYGLGSLRRPGPGLWPFAVSVVIVVLAVVLLVVGRKLDDSEKFTRASLLVLVGGATFMAFAALLPTIGFEIPSLLLCVVWLRFLGGESWRSTIVIASAPSPRSTCCSSTGCASRCPTCSERRAMD